MAFAARYLPDLTYLKNLIRLQTGDRRLLPLMAIYYVTGQCNFNCAYCEDFGQPRNTEAMPPLPLDDALRVLRIVRQGTGRLMLTGGEPLLHPDIVPLVERARRELKFRHITLTTNGSLLPKAEPILPHIQRLVISLDAVDPARWSSIIRMPVETAQAVLDNVRRAAALQRRHRFRLLVNAVVSPETLPGVPGLVEFCCRNHILLSFSPQMVNNWPRFELSTSPEYRAFLKKMIALKRRFGPLAASLAYLNMLLDLRPFSCYPTLTPRILPNGDLTYPCRPIEKSGHGHGGRSCNLLDVEYWADTQVASLAQYGQPPQVCSSCFQQCYAEPSLMQARPLSWLLEWLLYPASRRAGLTTYAPG